jgi:hypothetical protein
MNIKGVTLKRYRPRGVFWVLRCNVALHYRGRKIMGIKLTAGVLGYGLQLYTKGMATWGTVSEPLVPHSTLTIPAAGLANQPANARRNEGSVVTLRR